MARRPLVKSAITLMVAGLLNRVIGAVYRILLVRQAGADAVGLFQLALPLYQLAFHVVGLGLPVALNKVVAEQWSRHDLAGARGALTFSLRVTLLASLVAAAGLWAVAPWLAGGFFSDPRVRTTLLALPPAVAATACSQALRAYFHGRQAMLPSAASQVLEQLLRVPLALWLVAALLPRGAGAAAAGLMVATAAGEAAGVLLLLILAGRNGIPGAPRGASRRSAPAASRGLRAELFRLALPALASRLLLSSGGVVHAALVPHLLLAAGLPVAEATEDYGILTGMALPLLFLPMAVVFPVAQVLLPSVSAELALGHESVAREKVRKAYGATLAVGVGAMAVFWAFPEVLSRLLYDEPRAAPLIRLLALAAPLTYLENVAAAALNGMGVPGVVLRNYLAGLVVKLAVIVVLVPRPEFALMGAAWAQLAEYAVGGVLNLVEVERRMGRTR